MPIFSVFRPKVISEFKSRYSGQIQVKQDGTNRYVSVGNLTQSWGLVRDIWQPIIKKFGKKEIIGAGGCALFKQKVKESFSVTF